VNAEEEVVDGETFAGVLTDDSEGVGDFGVADGEMVAAASDDDTARWDEGGVAPDSVLELVEHLLAGMEADGAAVDIDTADGHLLVLAEEAVVVDAEDDDVFGDVEVTELCGVDDAAGEFVVGGEDGEGGGDVSEFERGEGGVVGAGPVVA
jgi:hypothetical protein